jgi:hypothetical protein
MTNTQHKPAADDGSSNKQQQASLHAWETEIDVSRPDVDMMIR